MTPETDDEPLTLEEACREIFRDAITPATLRAEAARGRLALERIGRRDFVTRAAIREMRKKCRVVPNPKGRASGSDPAEPVPADRRSPQSGSSATTEDTQRALDALLMSAREPSRPLRPTSRRSTEPHPENVIRLRG